jgi:molecular chaperone HscB
MNQKTGDDDPVLVKELETQKESLEAKHQALADELKTYWTEWDHASDAATQKAALNRMADLLNRRSYIRNLVRDVNDTLSNLAIG